MGVRARERDDVQQIPAVPEGMDHVIKEVIEWESESEINVGEDEWRVELEDLLPLTTLPAIQALTCCAAERCLVTNF
jgi:hypothetical protein